VLCIAFLTISVLLFLCVACGQRMENLLDQGYYRDSSGAMIFVDLDQIYNDNCTLSIDRANVFFNHLSFSWDKGMHIMQCVYI